MSRSLTYLKNSRCYGVLVVVNRLLLDTQIFLWALNEDPRLPMTIRESLDDAANELYLSVASLWEATIKMSLGKLSVPGGRIESLLQYADQTGTRILPIKPAHLVVPQDLPLIHRDPFDRMLVCQARVEQLRLVTMDALLRQYLGDALI